MTVSAEHPVARDRVTASEAVRDYTLPESETRALALRVASLRDETGLLHGDASALHHETREIDLKKRTTGKARNSVRQLLHELAVERGMAWADIADLVGVSVAAVRKWRTDGGATPDNRDRLARLAAFLDGLEDCGVADAAQWAEIALPLPAGYTITPLDVYRHGGEQELLDFACGHGTAETAADSAVPGWRQERASDFEVYDAADGHRALRMLRR
ncbi:MAG: helix-turn-helix transcriptional regulator [Actinobacteria bacterium]|nr:helix-turn-helix transcriptional regulator [Actinomycetota bacterium]